MKYTIFVGSSTERKEAATVLAELLRAGLEGDGNVQLWSDAFSLSNTNIESIEDSAREADFAVMLLTDDDVLLIRKAIALAPRDNITFEIGFFMGHLGRHRCYVVAQTSDRLRVATDLLGVTGQCLKTQEVQIGERP